MKKFFVLLAAVCLSPLVHGDEAKISAVTGTADVRSLETDIWYSAQKGAKVRTGQKVRTRARSRARIELSDGSRIELHPNSQIDLKELKSRNPVVKMLHGRLRAWVSKNSRRERFEVHTPVAVCSVRGTEFTVKVDRKGRTGIDVYEGLVGVRKFGGDGEEVPVGAGESLDVAADRPLAPEQKSEIMEGKQYMRREVGLDMSKEEVQAAAAGELRLAEYQEGKTMVDVNGLRVRMEEYIMRPAPDTFKFVVLNEREKRFDYFYYKGKFNRELPQDLSVALRDMNGRLGVTAPEYYLTEYEQVFSNTRDFSRDTAGGGHLVKITYNGNGTFTLADGADAGNTKTVNAADALNGAYDPLSDTFDPSGTSPLDITLFNQEKDAFETFSAGHTLWKTRFNSYEHVLNGVKKQQYLPSAGARNILVSDLDGHWVYPSLDSLGNTIYGEWGTAGAESSYPENGLLHNRLRITYRDDTFEQYDNYIISDEGKLAGAADFNFITTGALYRQQLLNWNYEQVLTASEFDGRKIDLVVEPKIFIESGLIR